MASVWIVLVMSLAAIVVRGGDVVATCNDYCKVVPCVELMGMPKIECGTCGADAACRQGVLGFEKKAGAYEEQQAGVSSSYDDEGEDSVAAGGDMSLSQDSLTYDEGEGDEATATPVQGSSGGGTAGIMPVDVDAAVAALAPGVSLPLPAWALDGGLDWTRVPLLTSVDLQPDLVMHWRLSGNHFHLILEGPAAHWMGWGISEASGGLPGSDILVVRPQVDAATGPAVVVEDRYADGRGVTVLDAHQDWTLIHHTASEQVQWVHVSRLVSTRDEHFDRDVPLARLGRGGAYLIYAHAPMAAEHDWAGARDQGGKWVPIRAPSEPSSWEEIARTGAAATSEEFRFNTLLPQREY